MNLQDVIENYYGKKSTIITQIPIKDWHDVIGDKNSGGCSTDRIVHQAIRIELYGESLRKKKI